MNFDEYQKAAERTMRLKTLPRNELVLHSLVGMCSEAGEVAGIYQKSLQGHPIDLEHLKKEVGDVLWMIAEFCTAHGWSMDEVAEINIAKLRERYPDGFSAEKSLHRREGDV